MPTSSLRLRRPARPGWLSDGRLLPLPAGRRPRLLLGGRGRGRLPGAGLGLRQGLGARALQLEQTKLHPQLDDGLALLVNGLVQVVVLDLQGQTQWPVSEGSRPRKRSG